MDSLLLACQLQDVMTNKKPMLREKLFNKTALSLSDEELVSILLRTGTKQYSLKKLSKKVLTKVMTYQKIYERLEEWEIVRSHPLLQHAS